MSRVAVVIPTFNLAQYLPEAVESALSQEGIETEVVVIDDGSTDDTRAVLDTFGERIRVVHQTNSGAASARNRGLAESSSENVCFLDGDDILHPNALATLQSALDADADVGVAYSGWVVVDETGRETGKSTLDMPSGDVFRKIVEKNTVGLPGSALVRRSIAEEAGGFDASLAQMEDWDFWVRCAMRSRFAFIPEHLVDYRQRAGGKSRRLAERRRVGEAILRKFETYHQQGLLDAATLARSKSNMREGLNALELQAAWSNYAAGDCREALIGFVRASARDPRALLNYGQWAATVKCVTRMLARRAGLI